jgi:hypothetical protein
MVWKNRPDFSGMHEAIAGHSTERRFMAGT